jgi:hypothetical protein
LADLIIALVVSCLGLAFACRLANLRRAGRGPGVTDAVYPGLGLTREIESVLGQGLGDVVLIDDTAALQGVAICHIGAGTEAGGGNCHVKFGAVRPPLSAQGEGVAGAAAELDPD